MRTLLAVLAPVAALLTLSCQDFSVAPVPPTVTVAVTPAEAFGGEEIRLTFDKALPLAQVKVQIAGQVARTTVDGEGLRVEVPRLTGRCEGIVLVQASLTGRELTTPELTYLGVGHPGEATPVVKRRVPVSFRPTSLAGEKSSFLLAGYGELVVAASSDAQARSVTYRRDFVVGMATTHCSEVVTAGAGGDLDVLPLDRFDRPAEYKPVSVPGGLPWLRTALPSALSQAPSLATAPLEQTCPTKDVTEEIRYSRFSGLLVPRPSTGALRFSSGDQSLSVLPAPALDGALATRPALAATLSESPPRFALAAATESGTRVLVTTPEGEVVAEGTKEELAGTVPTAVASHRAGALVVAAKTETGLGLVAVAFTPTVDTGADAGTGPAEDAGPGSSSRDDAGEKGPGGGAPLEFVLQNLDSAPPTALAVTGSAGTRDFVIGAVDGVDAVLRLMPVFATERGMTFELEKRVTLPEVPDRLAVVGEAPFATWLATSRSGTLMAVVESPLGTSVLTGRVRPRLSALAPRLRESCSAPEALVSAGWLGANVLVPLAEGGGPAAFLEGVESARAIDLVRLARPGKADLAYLVAGGTSERDLDGDTRRGLSISQTRVQLEELGGSPRQPKRVVLPFATRTLVHFVAADGQSTRLVAGGPAGLLRVGLSAGALPSGNGESDPSCPNVRQLAALGPRFAALAGTETASRLCFGDPATTGTRALDLPYPASALATSQTRSAGVTTSHLWTAGWEPQGATTTFVLRHATGEPASATALGTVDFGERGRLLLPTGAPEIRAMAASPDGRRLLVAFAGDRPGVLALDVATLLGSADAEQKARAITSIPLDATPQGLAFTEDGAQAVVALGDDTLAVIE